MTIITKTAVVRARMEPSVKKKAEIVLRKIGLSPSEAINVFYQRVASEQGIPFSINVPNKETRRAIKDARAGVNLKRFKTHKAFVDHIRSL